MKTLLLLRHAKSRHDNPRLTDHERPLAPRGERDAPRIGQLLQDDDIMPDLILCSTAERARQTAALVMATSGYGGHIHFTRQLFHAEPREIIEVACEVDDEIERLLLVGHNPGMNELMAMLTGDARSMPTAALAVIELPIDQWKGLSARTRGTLVEFWRPRDLRRQSPN